uniref:Uncharacterized protein n=1 Tax=Arundo donax TaxID=35708 RepID=A0A0A9BQI1_ARUDO
MWFPVSIRTLKKSHCLAKLTSFHQASACLSSDSTL